MSLKIGCYICHCGINIAFKVRVQEVAAFAEKLNSVVVSVIKNLCALIRARK